MPHNKLLHHIVNADLLLLTIPNTPNNEGILTGKLFEYIGSKNFILCFGPKDGDAAAIIDSLKCGTTLDFSEDPTEVILQKYREWQKNILSPVDSDSQEFTRFNLTKKLSDLFDSLI
ncbi:MAG: hypothetical protein U5K00_07250 [Melioribacteraceae bacterium]|nr:hypothetical protein [Melioribacteraceae bacterium]